MVDVSIPERVWGGLEHKPVADGGRKMSVSIPERVWGGLERALAWSEAMAEAVFQSLRGFGVGWSLLHYRGKQLGISFNP